MVNFQIIQQLILSSFSNLLLFAMFALTKITAAALVALSALPALTAAAPMEGAQLETRANSGRATYFYPGLGACGKTNGNGDYIVAVSKLLYDSYPGHTANPNNNPVCGRKIKASYGGKSVTVTVADRCESCAFNDLDFSPTAFQQLQPLSVGLFTVSWDWA
ncbi:hypothetical protein BOTBODRAFT_171877 [Botryobasidium botryosum FD-172 SS1]|uniref:RlpA-like protein double-psi beta-barrel domain-containing protein n=1 Tax=Botryobasidium botryosum (strain FD-172 SS1) TaxID=930990 RepID=A0A067N365_BOTB1|nr:hypothetical protein BOTBODRAFT_171877 [Botryobasidium botryosum FD-172 SS1]